MVHFRDREGEVERFYADVRRLRGVVMLYGPRGAGKSTLMRLMGEGIREVGGFEDTLFVRYSFAEVMIEEAHVSIPGVNEDSVREVLTPSPPLRARFAHLLSSTYFRGRSMCR